MADREAYVQADALIEFWNQAGPGAWFSKNPDFDQAFRERFTDAHFAAARCDLDHWMADADASLALVLLLDPFPRNAFRGTAHMYATDGLARHYARQALQAGRLAQATAPLALFFFVPFLHSDDIAAHRTWLTLYFSRNRANHS